MGFLTTLLTLPVSGPLAGLRFVAEKLTEAAIKEAFDPDAIKRQLIALEERLESGEIDEATYEADELILLQRLQDAKKYQSAGS